MSTDIWTKAAAGTPYDAAGRLAAVDKIAKKLDQFELTPVTTSRLYEALNVLDLLAAAAMDAIRTSVARSTPRRGLSVSGLPRTASSSDWPTTWSTRSPAARRCCDARDNRCPALRPVDSRRAACSSDPDHLSFARGLGRRSLTHLGGRLGAHALGGRDRQHPLGLPMRRRERAGHRPVPSLREWSMSAGTRSPLWDEWFDTQYDLNDAIDRVIKERTVGKGDGLRVALYSAVIENAAEAMRAFIPEMALDDKPVDR